MESTGTFPPAAVPMIAHNTQNGTKLLSPATAAPNTPPIRRVALNAGLRPIKSAEIPQNDAPIIKPT